MNMHSPGDPNANRMTGVVSRLDGAYAWVDVAAMPGCGNCKTQEACGSGLLGLSAASRQFRLLNTTGVRAGDAVTVALPDGGVFRAALLAYLMPLLLGLGGAVLGMAGGGSDAHAGIGLLAGLGSGWWLMRRLSPGREPYLEPTLQSRVIRLQPRFREEP